MSAFEIILASIGGSAVLFTVLALLARSLINQLLSKDIETFKKNLEKTAFEHQIQYSQLHEKRASVTADLYASLVELNKRAGIFVSHVMIAEREKTLEKLKELWKAADDFKDIFQKNRIYFDERICDKLEKLNESLSEPVSKLVMTLQITWETHNIEELHKVWRIAKAELDEKVPDIKKDVELEFRKLLGIESEKST